MTIDTTSMRPWRAGCSGTGTSGSEGGGEETTARKRGTGVSPPTLYIPFDPQKPSQRPDPGRDQPKSAPPAPISLTGASQPPPASRQKASQRRAGHRPTAGGRSTEGVRIQPAQWGSVLDRP